VTKKVKRKRKKRRKRRMRMCCLTNFRKRKKNYNTNSISSRSRTDLTKIPSCWNNSSKRSEKPKKNFQKYKNDRSSWKRNRRD